MIGNWEPSADALNRKKNIEGWENNLEIILENAKYLRPNKTNLKSFITFWTYRQIIFFSASWYWRGKSLWYTKGRIYNRHPTKFATGRQDGDFIELIRACKIVQWQKLSSLQPIQLRFHNFSIFYCIKYSTPLTEAAAWQRAFGWCNCRIGNNE